MKYGLDKYLGELRIRDVNTIGCEEHGKPTRECANCKAKAIRLQTGSET